MSEIRRDATVERELSGWWDGRATVDSPVDDKAYNDFFDLPNLGEHHEHMIKAISRNHAEGNWLGDIVPADMLNEDARDQIHDQIMDGNMFGTVSIDDNELEWSWYPTITLYGKDIDFQDDLSDASKEEITSAMLEGECVQGEVCERVNLDYSVYVDTDLISTEDEVISGTFEVYCESNVSAFNEDGVEFSFEYDQETGAISFEEFEDDDLYFAIKEAVQEAVDEYVKQKDVIYGIEVSSPTLSDGYLEGSVTVTDGNKDSDNCVYIFNTDTHEVELQKNSESGWITGASYEMPLPDIIDRNIEEVIAAIEEKCEDFSLDDRIAGFEEKAKGVNDGLESREQDDLEL